MIVRGFVVSLVFAIGWLALVVTSRPHVAEVTTDRAAVVEAIGSVETWSFTPALLNRNERAAYTSARQVEEARAGLAGADAEIGTRLPVAVALAVLGVLTFWGGAHLFAQGSMRVAGLALLVLGPFLACFVVRSFSGLVISGPPIATGVLIALFTLISKRSEAPS